MLQGIEPALFLVDIMLPDVSGVQLASDLRRSGFPATPMVAMSASPFIVDTARQSSVFQEVLAKPFDFEELLTAIHRYIA
jgi:CheY-like chemotaxis protein